MNEFLKNQYCFSKSMAMTDISESVVKQRENAISSLAIELAEYKIFFRDLYKIKPIESEANLILNVAYYIVDNKSLYEEMLLNKALPVPKLVKYTRRNNLFFEKWNDYIIIYTLILCEKKYKILKKYLTIRLTESLKEKNEESKIHNQNSFKGLIIASTSSSNIIMTKQGLFFRVRKDKGDAIGLEVHRQNSKKNQNWGIKILIVCLFVGAIGCALYLNYTKVVTTIMLQTSSDIRLDVNEYDKVIVATAKDKGGQELIDNTTLIGCTVDEALVEALRYAEKNEMIYDKKILITVLGKELDYGILRKTGAYLKSREINVLVNNAGQQHKLLESIENIL